MHAITHIDIAFLRIEIQVGIYRRSTAKTIVVNRCQVWRNAPTILWFIIFYVIYRRNALLCCDGIHNRRPVINIVFLCLFSSIFFTFLLVLHLGNRLFMSIEFLLMYIITRCRNFLFFFGSFFYNTFIYSRNNLLFPFR